MTKFTDLFKIVGEGELIKGVYLKPRIFFGEPHNKPLEYSAQIIAKFEIDTKDAYLTRYGCLFVIIPKELLEISKSLNKDAFDAIWQFDREIVSIFNKIVCEMILNISYLNLNTITQPSLCMGKKIENMAVLNASSSHENFSLSTEILSNERSWWIKLPPNFKKYNFETIKLMSYTKKLNEINKFLPLIISCAIYEFNNGLYSSSLLHSWMCIEIYIYHLWEKHRKTVEVGRKGRLKDHRAYSSSICIEILRTLDIFSQDLAEEIHKTRKLRNNLIHGSKGVDDYSVANVGIYCLKEILEILFETKLQLYLKGKHVTG